MTLADRLEQLAKAATPGPWTRLHDDPAATTTVVALEPTGDGGEAVRPRMSTKLSACDCGQVWSVPADAPVAYCDTRHMGEGPTGPIRMANAALIVALVNSLPEIILALRSEDGLRSALRPFGKMADTVDKMRARPVSDDAQFVFPMRDLRAARKALSAGEAE